MNPMAETRKRRSLLTGLLIASWAVSLVLGLLLFLSEMGRRNAAPIIRTAIAEYSGTIDSGIGEVNVIVYRDVELSSAWDLQTINQNKIVVWNDKRAWEFMWPERLSYAANSVEVVDVDRDGKPEFLFEGCCDQVRIVQFVGGVFSWREERDTLKGLGSGSGLKDLDSDGRLEFLAVSRFPQEFGEPNSYKVVPVPRVFRWTPSVGFNEVSRTFSAFYANDVLPGLTKQMEEEKDNLRKELFSRAIKHVQREYVGLAEEP